MRDEYLLDIDQFWAVRINGEQGANFALNGEGGRYLFGTKNAAKEFCRELREHLESPCRVVRVSVVIAEIPRCAPVTKTATAESSV